MKKWPIRQTGTISLTSWAWISH